MPDLPRSPTKLPPLTPPLLFFILCQAETPRQLATPIEITRGCIPTTWHRLQQGYGGGA